MFQFLRWSMVSRARFIRVNAFLWTAGVALASPLIVSYGGGAIEVVFCLLWGALTGALWAFAMWHVLPRPRYPSSQPGTTERLDRQSAELARELQLKFPLSISPDMARDAARAWFWRMVYRDRLWPMSLSMVLAIALSGLGFWLEQPLLGWGFAVMAVLVLMYFPVFHFGFQYEAARHARVAGDVTVAITGESVKATWGKRSVTFDLDAGVEVIERPGYLLLWFSRYGWLVMPTDQVPDDVLRLLRALAEHSPSPS
jgi:hypothetical protein